MENIDESVMRQSAKRWLIFFTLIMLFSFTLLGYRLIDVQVIRHDQLRDSARGNHIRTVVLQSQRGDILDSRGNLMATSLFVKTVYTLCYNTDTFRRKINFIKYCSIPHRCIYIYIYI